MPFTFNYMPVLRARQQELLVLNSFAFEQGMVPLLEIIKAKDRVNNRLEIPQIWLEHIRECSAQRILVDLPAYIRDAASMSDEVVAFNRTTLSNKERRIEFFQTLAPAAAKVIPVVSSLFNKTRDPGTIAYQINGLRQTFGSIAIRTFGSTFEQDIAEIEMGITDQDILIYDLDTAQPLHPLVRRHKARLDALQVPYKVAIRSAINTDIQNIKLVHGEIIPDADNSLLDVYHANLGMDAFGDYAGIKKDDLSSGGTISPGFIFYDPIDNLYYGFRGDIKDLGEFERTIVPAVLNSDVVQRILADHPSYLSTENAGYQQLLAIQAGKVSGKSQAKFKRISIEHYLHCIRTKIRERTLA